MKTALYTLGVFVALSVCAGAIFAWLTFANWMTGGRGLLGAAVALGPLYLGISYIIARTVNSGETA